MAWYYFGTGEGALVPANEGVCFRLEGGKKRFLRRHVGAGTEYLGIRAAWTAFKSSVREGEIGERIDLLESYRFQTRASFKVKDRYRVG